MTRLPLLLAACSGAPGRPGEPGELAVRIAVDAGEDQVLDELAVTIGEVVFDARGEDGIVSVSVSSGVTIVLAGESESAPADPSPTVRLAPGAYRDAEVEVRLRGERAFEAAGLWEDVRWTVRLDPLALRSGEESVLEIAAESQVLTFTLRPDQWFDGIDLEELAEGEENEVEFDSESHPVELARIAENVVDSTEAEFPDADD